MTPHDGSFPTAPADPDDERIAGLVRSVADDWHMPPQRLGDPTWRERTGRRGGHRHGRVERVIGPIAAALVATVVLALGAVWLTTPRPNRGVAAGPSGSSRATAGSSATSGPRASGGGAPAVTPLPALQRNGDLPDPATVLVRSDGAFHVADVSTGILGPAVFGTDLGPTVVAAPGPPGGRWLCVCATWTDMGSNGPGGARITLQTADANGTAGTARELRVLAGVRDPARALDSGSPLVDVGTSLSTDGRYAFVGWSERHGAHWTAGVDVVDVRNPAAVTTLAVPVADPDITTDMPIIRLAPAATLSPDGTAILVSSAWYVDDPSRANVPSGTDHWIGRFSGGRAARLSAAGSTAATQCAELTQGLVGDDRYYVLCSSASGPMTLDRLAADGTVLGKGPLPDVGGGTEGGSLAVRVGDALFVWGPITRTLVRLDLQTGKVDSAIAPAASVEDGPSDRLASLGHDLGRWLAPAAGAKTFLDPGIVASPDGTRIYAIGIVGSSDPGSGGSTGVFVFDASTLQPVGHWQPTADLSSIALTADGHYLFAGAAGGVDAAGQSSGNGASITVFDTTDGSVDLIAGKLGYSELSLTDRTIR